MDWAIVDGKLVLGTQPCTRCRRRPGKEITFRIIPCPQCRGTGRRANGRCHECTSGLYSPRVRPGYVRDTTDAGVIELGPCTQCHGTAREPATLYSWLPTELLQDIPIEFVDKTAPLTWGEYYLGGGPHCLFTIVDYGQPRDKDEIIAKIRHCVPQVCAIVRSADDLRICKKIVVTFQKEGYSANAVFD